MYFLCKLPMRWEEAVGESESSQNAKKNKKKQQKSMMMENWFHRRKNFLLLRFGLSLELYNLSLSETRNELHFLYNLRFLILRKKAAKKSEKISCWFAIP